MFHGKMRKAIAIVLVLAMIITVLPTMDASAKTAGKSVPVLNEDGITLYLKDSYATSYGIQIENLSSNAKVTFKSSNKKVATVNNEGIVTPHKKGKATITAKVKQAGMAYQLKLACEVKNATLRFTSKGAKNTSAESPAVIEIGTSLSTGLKLSGAENVSVFSSSNSESYNVKAVIYNAKTGKKLTKAQNSSDNKYISISENGTLSANKKGEYYIEFTSVPAGCQNGIYVSVIKAKKQNKVTQTEKPKQKATPTPLPGVSFAPKVTEKPEITEEPSISGNDTPIIPVIPDVPVVTAAPSEKEQPSSTVTPVPDEMMVKFDFVKGSSSLLAELPENKMYKTGTPISELPHPYSDGTLFLGWYYDADGKNLVGSTDVIGSEMTLYAELQSKMEDDINEIPISTAITLKEDETEGFYFEIRGYKEGCIDSFINAATDTEINYSVTGEKIFPELEAGKTYLLTLKNNSGVQLVLNGELQAGTITTLTIVTERQEVMNLSLDKDMKFIKMSDISEMKGQMFDGLLSMSQDGENGTNEKKDNKGTFRYSGEGASEIKVGDTVAVYEGQNPSERTLLTSGTDDDGSIAYITITGKNGDEFSFSSAGTEDVISVTEILPVNVNADTDGEKNNHSIRVHKNTFDYSGEVYAELGYDGNTTADVGDFLMFYSGSLVTGNREAYAKITAITSDGDYLIIDYEDSNEDEIVSSMDLYAERNDEINLTDEEIEQITSEIKEQAYESGFIDDASNYLVALAMETDGFKELSADFDLDLDSYKFKISDLTTSSTGDEMLLMDSSTSVSRNYVDVDVRLRPGTNLEHIVGKNGLYLELGLYALLTLYDGSKTGNESGGYLQLEFSAVFSEEIYITPRFDGSAKIKWKWIIPYVADYNINASFDIGSYTSVDIQASVVTAAKDRTRIDNKTTPLIEKGKDKLGVNKSGKAQTVGNVIKRDIGRQLKDEWDKWVDPNEIDKTIGADAASMDLAEKYSAFIKRANNTWIPIVKEKILPIKGSIDPCHILCFGLNLYFVVNVNMYVSIGFSWESIEANRYIYNISLFSRKVTSKTVPIMPKYTEYEYFVFGTAGIRVGIEMELEVGLVSLSFDSVALIIEFGVYAQLWGFFYARYCKDESQKDEDKIQKTKSGAFLFEVGFYLEVKIRAQLLNKAKLTANKMLVQELIPLFSVGERKNVRGFAGAKKEDGVTDEDVEELNLVGVKDIRLGSDVFDMVVLDLTTGKLETQNYDDDTESRYTIILSNDKFSYDTKTNILKVNVPGKSSDKETCQMRIIWNGNSLSFDDTPIVKTINIIWTDPENARYISFDSNGGSCVKSISGLSGNAITAPENPTRAGYIFKGWYSDTDFTKEYIIPNKMPNFENRGIVLYAKWDTAKDTPYTVNYYVENLNGQYEIRDTVVCNGETNTVPDLESLKKAYEGTKFNNAVIKKISPDGQAVMYLYYKLNEFDIDFSYGEFEDDDREKISSKYKYGATCFAPELFIPGYDFCGYEGLETDEEGFFTVAQDAEYVAQWKPSENTGYVIEHYLKNPEDSTYELIDTVYCTGITDSEIDIEAGKLIDNNYQFEKISTVNTDSSKPVITSKGNALVKYYYDRTPYTLTYMNGSSNFGTAVKVKWGTSIEEPAVTPVKKGFVFTGWYSDISCDEESLVDFSEAIMPESSVILYAGWKAAEDTGYTVEYYGQNANNDGYSLLERDDSFKGTTGAAAVAEYKSFEHFTADTSSENTVNGIEISPEGDTVLKLYYSRNTIDITFEAEGGELGDSAVKTFRYGQNFIVSAPSREDYAFMGWYLSDGTKYDKVAVDETSDITLLAGWDAGSVNYRVEHYVMGTNGEYPSVATYSETLNATVDSDKLFRDLKKSSLEVEGGIVCKKALSDGNTEFVDISGRNASVTIKKNMTVKLYYEREKYEVKWQLGSLQPQNEYTHGMVCYDEAIVAPVIPDIAGYINGFTTSVEEKVPAHNVEYTFRRTPITYRVSFNKNAASSANEVNAMSSMNNLVYDESYQLSANVFTRRGYSFIGWSKTQNASSESDVDFTDGAEINNLSSEQNGMAVLYAVWKPVSYSIELVGSVQWNENLNVTTNYDSNNPIVTEYTFGEGVLLPNPSCVGFDFDGWYDNAGYEGASIVSIGRNETGNKKFWPKWKLHEYEVTWNANGGNFALSEGQSSNTYSSEATIVDIIAAPELVPTKNSTPEFSYEFDGWYTSKNGGTKLEDCENLDVTKHITFYAHWTATKNTYSVKWVYSLDGEVSTSDYEVVCMVLEIMAVMSLDKSFLEVDGETFIDSFTEICWDSEMLLDLYNNLEYFSVNTMSEEALECWEKYFPTGIDAARVYEIACLEEELNVEADYSKKVEYGTKIVSPLFLNNEDSCFEMIGWYDINDCELKETTTVNNQGETVPYYEYVLKNPDAEPLTIGTIVTGDVTYVMVYELKQLYITWDTNVADPSAVTFSDGYTCQNGPEKFDTTVVFPELTREPDVDKVYTFDGWYTSDVSGVGEKITSATLEDDVTYYARWNSEPREYQLTFEDINGGETVKSYEYGTKLQNKMTELSALCSEESDMGKSGGYVLYDAEKDEPILDSDGNLQYLSQLAESGAEVSSDAYFKEDWIYPVCIFGEWVHSFYPADKNYVPSDEDNSGTATFDLATQTITLDNCKVNCKTNLAVLDDNTHTVCAIGSKLGGTLKIVLSGENIIDVYENSNNLLTIFGSEANTSLSSGLNEGVIRLAAISVSNDSNLTISEKESVDNGSDGTGSLEIRTSYSDTRQVYLYGIYAENTSVLLMDGVLDICCGLNPSINIACFDTSGEATRTSSGVTGDENGNSLWPEYQYISLIDQSSRCYGIYADNFVMQGGSLIIWAALDKAGNGIYQNGNDIFDVSEDIGDNIFLFVSGHRFSNGTIRTDLYNLSYVDSTECGKNQTDKCAAEYAGKSVSDALQTKIDKYKDFVTDYINGDKKCWFWGIDYSGNHFRRIV